MKQSIINIRKRIDLCKLTIKYWLAGDSIDDAYQYAKAIIYGFKVKK